MDAPDWVFELAALAELFRETGVIHDLANMSMADRYDVLLYLRRQANGEE